jgi:quaternary ammonium compound-resistance protein SugE
MPWLYLILAGVFEIVWVVSLKYTVGFTRLWPSLLTIFTGATSLVLLAQAVKTLPIGTAYAVWTSVGTVGAALLGMLLFGEPRDWPRLMCLALIVIGVVGLKYLSPH